MLPLPHAWGVEVHAPGVEVCACSVCLSGTGLLSGFQSSAFLSSHLFLASHSPSREVCYLWRFSSAQKQVREGCSQSLPHTAKPDTLGPPESPHSGLWFRQQRLVPDPGWLSQSLAGHYLRLQQELSSRVGKALFWQEQSRASNLQSTLCRGSWAQLAAQPVGGELAGALKSWTEILPDGGKEFLQKRFSHSWFYLSSVIISPSGFQKISPFYFWV